MKENPNHATIEEKIMRTFQKICEVNFMISPEGFLLQQCKILQYTFVKSIKSILKAIK